MTTQPPTDGSSPSRLGERYELGALIGRGGMADVRAGRDLRLGRTVAIKRLRTDLASDPTFQARFRREAQSAASLNHPAIVAVYDTAEESDNEGHLLPYIVMEYVEGRTLREVLREGRKILPERALEITADVLSALDYSHRAGIVHRDIKPANVMLTPNGQVKVMDFGIARAVADSSATMTQTAAVLGTAQYLSPEQARGEPVDARSDIYSTGCLLYELLTGRPPFIGDSPVSVAYQHVRETPERPSLYNPEVTDDVDAIVAKALTKRIENRYQSAAEMRSDIERALAGQSVTAPAVIGDPNNPGPYGDDAATAVVPAMSDYDDEPPTKRRKWPWVLLGLLLLAVIAAFFIIPAVFGGGGDDGPDMSVPNVVGQKLDDAKKAIEEAHLTVGHVTHEPSAAVDKGKVISQDPDATEFLFRGDPVNLVVSTGPKMVEVPNNLVGMTLKEAKQALEAVNLEWDVQRQQSDQPKNEVLGTDPSSGDEVKPGSTVTLTVAAPFPVVPNVVGDSEDEAVDKIKERGFSVDIRLQTTDRADEGTVIEQTPSGGSKALPGSTVTIFIAVAPQETTPPTTETPPTTPTNPTPTSPTISLPTFGDGQGG
ncbi:MAG TPA: Stk1 family PASTA domain-containing Ser/Thr kinase [Nocardioidaceae bacterium]|nr:Stk1 family PASTA domain-containing Ser/Thr kinase [Nocardioidaceae bacterium]